MVTRGWIGGGAGVGERGVGRWGLTSDERSTVEVAVLITSKARGLIPVPRMLIE